MTWLWLKVFELVVAVVIVIFCQFVVAPMAARVADLIARLVVRFKRY